MILGSILEGKKCQIFFQNKRLYNERLRRRVSELIVYVVRNGGEKSVMHTDNTTVTGWRRGGRADLS